jgi:plasmid replication initiation protein
MTVSEFKKQQREKLAAQKIANHHPKVSNSFIDATLHKSNLAALKIIYYLATILKDFDHNKEMDDITIDLRLMLKYTGLTAKDIKNNLITMQETSVSFIDEKQNIETFINLLPYIEFVWGKNLITIKLFSKIAKLIVEVTNNYTFINVKQLMRLQNKHTLKLLPILNKISQYDKNVAKRAKYDLGELNDLFGTSYKRLADIERKIIKPVKEELDEESELSFIYEIDYTNLGVGRPKAYQVTIDLIQKKYSQPRLAGLAK